MHSSSSDSESEDDIKLIGFPIRIKGDDLKKYLKQIQCEDVDVFEVHQMKTFVIFL